MALMCVTWMATNLLLSTSAKTRHPQDTVLRPIPWVWAPPVYPVVVHPPCGTHNATESQLDVVLLELEAQPQRLIATTLAFTYNRRRNQIHHIQAPQRVASDEPAAWHALTETVAWSDWLLTTDATTHCALWEQHEPTLVGAAWAEYPVVCDDALYAEGYARRSDDSIEQALAQVWLMLLQPDRLPQLLQQAHARTVQLCTETVPDFLGAILARRGYHAQPGDCWAKELPEASFVEEQLFLDALQEGLGQRVRCQFIHEENRYRPQTICWLNNLAN